MVSLGLYMLPSSFFLQWHVAIFSLYVCVSSLLTRMSVLLDEGSTLHQCDLILTNSVYIDSISNKVTV